MILRKQKRLTTNPATRPFLGFVGSGIDDMGELIKLEFIKEDMDETVFMFALFKCRKFDKRRN